MNITDLTPSQLRNAADIQEKIQGLQKELNSILGGEIPIPATVNGEAPKRKMSAAGRARIAAAAKARWAKIRGTSGKPAKKSKLSAQGLANIRAGVLKRMKNQAKATSKPKREMSAAGRARLSALAKARWKNARAAGKGTL
jgi:hypothetical protein